MVCKLERNKVCSISYLCRIMDPRDEQEEGFIVGYWTGELDHWGKYTIKRVDGDDTLYLFADEIIEVGEPL